MNKIWCLFSIENDYDQPFNNLVTWWSEKPTVDKIANAIGLNVDVKQHHDCCGKLYSGIRNVRISNADYRIEEIFEATAMPGHEWES